MTAGLTQDVDGEEGEEECEYVIRHYRVRQVR